LPKLLNEAISPRAAMVAAKVSLNNQVCRVPRRFAPLFEMPHSSAGGETENNAGLV